jgi:hypothetical protein
MSIDPYKWGQKFHKSLKDYLNGIGNQQNHFITDARIVTALNLGGLLEKLADLGRTVAGTGATLDRGGRCLGAVYRRVSRGRSQRASR